MAADCKSADERLRWFESSPLHHPLNPRGRVGDGVQKTVRWDISFIIFKELKVGVGGSTRV